MLPVRVGDVFSFCAATRCAVRHRCRVTWRERRCCTTALYVVFTVGLGVWDIRVLRCYVDYITAAKQRNRMTMLQRVHDDVFALGVGCGACASVG